MNAKVDKSLIDQFDLLHKRFQKLTDNEKQKYFTLKKTVQRFAKDDYDRITGVDSETPETRGGLTNAQKDELEDLERKKDALDSPNVKRRALLRNIKRYFEQKNREKAEKRVGEMHIDDPVRATAEVVLVLAEALNVLSEGESDKLTEALAKAKAIKNSFHG